MNKDIETEIEKLALKFRTHESKLFDSQHIKESDPYDNSYKIDPQSRIKNYSNLKLVTIHPEINNQINFFLTSARDNLNLLKKLISNS